VREALHGLKPLTDKDRSEIAKNINDHVLHRQPIAFRSSAARLADGDERFTVEGKLTMARSTRPVDAQLDVGAAGRVSGTIPLTQNAGGISPTAGSWAH
jgi:hypothetical protein